MPKKMGINSKAAEAKARKDTVRKTKEEQIQKQKEDEQWRDDDKHVNRKLERQNEKEKKRIELAQRKAQNKTAFDEELSQLEASKAAVAANAKASKVTRLQIQNIVARKVEESGTPKKGPTHLEVEIQENVNRLEVEGEEARNIDEAITVLR